MKREDLEHVIKAAAEITQDEIVVVGSQAVLAQFPNAPPSLLRSQEADVYPLTNPDRTAEIDGALGDGSPFHAESWSLEIHDLLLAKLVAGRAHDIEFTATLRERLVDLDRLQRGLDLMTPADRAAAEPRLERLTLHRDR